MMRDSDTWDVLGESKTRYFKKITLALSVEIDIIYNLIRIRMNIKGQIKLEIYEF